MANIYIIQDVEITLTMPDDSTQLFTLEKPNSRQNPYWFRIVAEAPSGERIYKDPSRTRQTAFVDFAVEFHFGYDHHRMFTTPLLVAKNILLKHSPPFDNPMETNCLYLNDEARKNWLNGIVAAADGAGQRGGNPIPSGSEELVFISKAPLDWQEALQYEFYQQNP